MSAGRHYGPIAHPGPSRSHPHSIHHPRPPGFCSLAYPSLQSRLPEDHGQEMTLSKPVPTPLPCSEPAMDAPGGSRQTTVSPGTPGSGGSFEGKVHFINQPIVGLPSADSSSPGVSLGAVDTDVNCQECPPPPSWGVLQARYRASVAMLPTGPLQEPRLPHLRNCQNMTGYFITRLAMAAAADTDRYGRYLTVCQMTNPN